MPTSLTPPPKDDETECGNCGAYIYHDLLKCPNCGAYLLSPHYEEDEKPSNRPKESSKNNFRTLTTDLSNRPSMSRLDGVVPIWAGCMSCQL